MSSREGRTRVPQRPPELTIMARWKTLKNRPLFLNWVLTGYVILTQGRVGIFCAVSKDYA